MAGNNPSPHFFINPACYHYSVMKQYLPILPQYVPEEPEADFFTMKKELLERKAQSLEEQLHQHGSQLQEHLKTIEYDLCECTNAGYRLPYGDISGYNRIQLRYRVKLYQERRKLESDYLRQTSMLRKDLLDTQLELRNLEEKIHLLQ